MMAALRHFICVILLCLSASLNAIGQEHDLPPPFINDAENGLVYNTVFMYNDHSFSGLMVVKKQESDYRVMLLSKMGPSIMDFTLTEDRLIWKKAPQGLEKRVITNIMERDFRLILLRDLENPRKVKKTKKGYTVKDRNKIRVKMYDDRRIAEVETKNLFSFFRSHASFFYLNEDNIPDEICVSHQNIKMKLEMKLLNQ